MSILVEGTLKSPAGSVIGNADIVLTSISTSLVVLGGAPLSIGTDANGQYSFTLHNGNFAVSVSKDGNNWFSGVITVTDMTVPKSLNALLLNDAMMAEIPADYWSYFQAQTGILFTSFSKIDESVKISTEAKQSSLDSKNKAGDWANVATSAAAIATTASQNAITTANLYPSVEEAQAAISAGKIPLDALFVVAVPVGTEPSRYADQYRNFSGIATKTGVSYPSSESINFISSRLKSIKNKWKNAFTDSRGRVGAGLNNAMAWCAVALQGRTVNVANKSDDITMQVISQKGEILISRNGRVCMKVMKNGLVRIASLGVNNLDAKNIVFDLDGKNISESIVPSAGGFRDDTAGALANYVGLGGMASAYGNVQTKEPGIALRRLGTVLSRDTKKPWMSAMVESPVIWFDDVDMKYHMVFTAYSGSYAKPGNGSVGHATSIDLINWSVDAQPLLSGSNIEGSPDKSGCTGPYMLKGDDGIYYLFYIGLPAPGYENGIKRLCLVTAPSLNGPWERRGVMIDKDAAHPWRADDVYHASIVNRNGTYYLFFNSKGRSATGGNDSQGNERIGYATSKSLLGPWVVDDANAPIINTENNTWKSIKVGDPSIYRDGNLWFMNYFSYDGKSAYDSIAVTTDEDFPLGWREYGQPVLSPIPTVLNEKLFIHKPFVIYVAGRKYHFTTGVGDSDRVIVAYTSGSGVDDRFAPGTNGTVRTLITPSLVNGEAMDQFLPEVNTLPVIRVGQKSDGSWRVERANSNGFLKLQGIDFDGKSVSIGDDYPISETAKDGFAYLPVVSGEPIGIPTPKSGKAPFCIDPTNKKIWVYVSGNWISSNLS